MEFDTVTDVLRESAGPGLKAGTTMQSDTGTYVLRESARAKALRGREVDKTSRGSVFYRSCSIAKLRDCRGHCECLVDRCALGAGTLARGRESRWVVRESSGM